MKAWGIVIILLLVILTALFYTANQGNISSTIVLTVFITEALNLVGAGTVLLVIWLIDKRQQRDFRNNAKENLALMSAVQDIQNKQNLALIQQLNTVNKLPLNHNEMSPLLIEDGLFDELDD